MQDAPKHMRTAAGGMRGSSLKILGTATELLSPQLQPPPPATLLLPPAFCTWQLSGTGRLTTCALVLDIIRMSWRNELERLNIGDVTSLASGEILLMV